MEIISKKILDDALLLSEADRADLAACLFASLDAEKVLDQSWEDEIQTRLREIDETGAVLIPWDKARERIFGNEQAS